MRVSKKEIIRVTLGKLDLLCSDILKLLTKPTNVNLIYKRHVFPLKAIELIREKTRQIKDLTEVAYSYVAKKEDAK